MAIIPFLDTFRWVADLTKAGDLTPRAGQAAISSPWTTSQLQPIVWADIFGADVPRTVSRKSALRVPAIAKGRALIVGTLSRQPLAKFRGSEKVSAEPWMYRTSTKQSPRQRMLWTIDDILFTGMSLWAVQRGSKGQILDAIRVPRDAWEIDPDLRIVVNGRPQQEEEVILLEGPQEGLLEIAAGTIESATNMERSWGKRVESPVPLMELHSTDPNGDLTTEEATALTSEWDVARVNGGTAYTPAGIEARVHGNVVADLYISGRNAIRLDVANFLGLPGSLLDGSTATASLTYSTKEGSRNELVDLSLAYWANPIEARLSQDDVTPAGTRVAFDLEYLATPTQPAQGPAHED